MRVLIFLVAVLLCAAAQAQNSVYYAERGHWLVANGTNACRALNRPPAEFNYAPYNALQIAVRPGRIGVEVFFWPQAIDLSRTYRLTLQSGKHTITLDAKATIGDYVLVSAEDPKLWRLFQDGEPLRITVEGEPELELYFGLEDMDWVVKNLDTCLNVLPKE
jgi:hypothetical protein